jgi:hypothetical protein
MLWIGSVRYMGMHIHKKPCQNVLERLGIKISDQVPEGFEALTFKISLKEEGIIQSIWSTSGSSGVIVTRVGDRIQFWQKSHKRMLKCFGPAPSGS